MKSISCRDFYKIKFIMWNPFKGRNVEESNKRIKYFWNVFRSEFWSWKLFGKRFLQLAS